MFDEFKFQVGDEVEFIVTNYPGDAGKWEIVARLLLENQGTGEAERVYGIWRCDGRTYGPVEWVIREVDLQAYTGV